MVRETRYLLVGNLPENVTEEEISEYFKRFSKIQSVKIHGKKESEDFVCATVAFADIKSASKANNADNSLCGKVLTTAYSEGSATGSVVKRTLDEPRPSFSAIRPSTFPRKGPEDGEVYEGRDYYSSQLGQYNTGYTEEYQRGRPRDRFPPRGGFKQFDRGGHHQWTAGRRFGEGHRSNSSSDRDAFEKPRPPQSPARSTSQTSRKSPKMKRKQSNSTSRSRSGSSDSSSSSSYSDSSSDSSRSRSKSGRSSTRAGRSKLPSTGSQVKSGRSRSQESIGSDNTETTEGGGRPHGIRITNLPGRSSDTSLRDGLFHEYKKYGKVNAVQISGNGDGRYAIVSFKKSEDARKANVASQDKRFFGANIRVSEHEGIDVDDAEFRPPEAELDEHHPKATRTLFVGNLEKEITMEELKDMFSKYGDILDIDVKRQGAISAYSFIQFTDIRSVVKALRALDGETMGGMKLKLGFGKSMPTNCVWVDNLADTVQEKFLFRQFNRYGPVSNMVIDRERGKALIFFSSLESAQFALSEMRNRILNGQKIQIDFGSRDCQTDFYDKMEKSGQLKPGQRSNLIYQRQTSDTQRPERGRGKFPFPRGRGFVRGGRGGRYIAGHAGYGGKEYHEDYKWQRYNEEYSQGGGGGTPYSEGDFETDLHAYRTQRERQRSCSPDQYSDDMYNESYREYKTRYAEYPGGSPGSDDTYDYKNRDEIYYKERYVIGSREASPEGSFHGREWSNSPTRNRVKDPERNTPPTPLGGEDTQDFSSQEQSPSEMDSKISDKKRSGKDDFDITEADIQELRTTNKYSAHRKESLSRSEERYSRKRSYDDSFTRDSISKEDTSVRKLDRQLSHGSHDKLSDSKRDLFHKMKKLQSEIGNKSEGQCSSNSSDSDRGSLTGGDLSKLKHERQLLLEKIKMCEDTNNSDSERLDLDALKKSPLKRPRLDPWSGKSASGQRLQSELGSVILGPKKEKSYDVSQSYRKQMETIRKNEEKSVKDDSFKSKKNDIYSYDDDKEDLIPQGLLSPKDVPTAFVKKRKKTEVSDEKSRMYRQKREIEDERMSSDNEESARNVTRTDSVGSLGSIRRLSSGHSSPRTPITGHLSLESIDHRLSESEQSLTFKKLDSSGKRRSKDDHSSPVIIPLGEDILVTDIPDPRVPKEKCEEDFCLPLPKFAEYTPPVKLNSPHSENSGDVSKEDSPCFSPPSSGSKNESPQLSPNDTNSEESHTLSNQEPTYIPEEISNNSNEPSIDTLENQDMEAVKPHTEVDLDEGLSDGSDHNDDFCLEERIRKLDEKLNQLPTTQPSKLGTENVSSTSIGINMSSSNPPSNIYSKFKIKKRQDSNGVGQEESGEKGDKPSSEIVKTMLNRSSIFDLDSKRLEQINEKYSPNMKSVVSNAEDSPKGVTLRTKAETKEMPLSTLPGSLAGRLGNGGSSFPTLSVNTQPNVPLSVKIDDKPVNSLSPGSLKGPFSHDQNSQENKTADMCSYNSDNRIYNISDRMDVQNPVIINYSPRFNSIDNGINKTSLSTRTMVESAIESAEKSDNLSPVDSNVKVDPRLNSKNALYNKTNKIADDNMDLNKKFDTRKSPSKSLDMNSSKIEVKSDSVLKNDIASDHILGSKISKSDNGEDSSAEISSTVSIERKRKSETPSKKDKIKNTESKTISSTDMDKESSKSDVKSGSESPESKRAKISTPEKDKSETNSPTHSESAKSDKLKKDSDKKNKENKKKDKSECDSMNKDKEFNDKKDKDHDGDKTKSSAKNVENESKVDDKSVKLPSDFVKKETLNKTEGKDIDKLQSKKDTDKKTEHNTAKKEKKSEGSSSKKSSESKTDSAHKKESKSSDSKTKDKTKSSHKTKDSSKQKDGSGKSSGKASKSGSTEKVEQTKDQVKETVPSTENTDKKETKESEIKSSEKSQDANKEKIEKSSEILKEKEKSTDVTKDKTVPTTSEKPKEKSNVDNKHKPKVDKSKEKSGESAKHKAKSETSEQHKTKSSHDNSKKEKSAEKTKHTKLKDKTSSENVKSKDKSAETKQTTAEKPPEPDSNVKNELKTTDSELAKSAEKLKSSDDVKTKEKSENGKQKEKSGNGSTLKKEKGDHEKPKSTESSTKTKEKTKHTDGSHGKKSKEDKMKSPTAASSIDKTTKDKSHKDNNKKDEDRSKSDPKKEGNGDNKSSNASKTSTDSSNASKTSTDSSNASKTSTDSSNASKNSTDSSNTSKTSTDSSNASKTSTDSSNASKTTNEGSNSSDKKENNGNNHDNKSEKSENKNDGKSENSSGNTDSLSKSSDKSESKKERKKSGENSKSSSKSSGKKSSSEKKSDSKSSDRKSSKKDKDSKKEEKTSPKEDKHKKTPKKEVEFDWSAWVEEPYVSMYDRVKRKSSEKDKEREMQVTMKRGFNNLAKRRNNKKHNKFGDSDDSDFSHDSAEETDAFEEEKVAKPNKEVVNDKSDNGPKRKRCVIDTSTSSDDDDSQFYKSFQKNSLNNKEKSKGLTGKSNKHSVNDIYSSDSSETDIDFPPISPAKKKIKKTKTKSKKPQIHHDTDSDLEHGKEKQKKKKSISSKPKPKSTPKKKSDVKPPPATTQTDTHESDMIDVDSEMDIFDRIKLKNQKKKEPVKDPVTPNARRFDTTTDDSDNHLFSPNKSSMAKTETKPAAKKLTILSDLTSDSDSSFPDLSPKKNCVTKKNHTLDSKKPAVTVGAGVIAQTIRNEDLGEKKDDIKKKEKMKKKSKKNEIIKSDDKKVGEDGKGLFEKMENLIPTHGESKDKNGKHKKEGKSPKDLPYLDEEEISQAEKLVNNMNKLEKPTKHDSTKLNKTSKQDHEKTSTKSKTTKLDKMDHTFSSETETDKESKSHSTDHVIKSESESRKDADDKKSDQSVKTKPNKMKKKKHDSTTLDSVLKVTPEVSEKKDVDTAKKVNNKIESIDGISKKKINKIEIEDMIAKKPTSKLDMDDGLLKKHNNKVEKDIGYKIGFGFFEDFPILEESKLDDIPKKKEKEKKQKKNKDDEQKTPKKEAVKSEGKTPKKKDRKKKDGTTEMITKENGPKLEELVGKLAAGAMHNSDVFEFQDEEEDDNKPLFADFFKMKEEMTKKAAATKKDKPDGKKENRLSSEEKSEDSESHTDIEDGKKSGHKDKKDKIKSEEAKNIEKLEESIKDSLFGPNPGSKIDETSITSMFSSKHVKEACKEEAKNIMGFASPKGMVKSDDESCKSLTSPTKSEIISPKDKYRRDMVVGHVDFESFTDIHKKDMEVKSKEISSAEEKWQELIAGKEDAYSKKIDIFTDNLTAKSDVHTDKCNEEKKGKVEEKIPEKPEVPEKSREEIVEEAVSSLQKITETPSVVTPEVDNYQDGDLVIDETTAAVETVTEEPVLAEQAQNETDLAILSILQFDEKAGVFPESLPQQNSHVEPQPEVPPENVVIEPEQITLETNPLDSSIGSENDLVIDTSAPEQVEPQNDINLPITASNQEKPVVAPIQEKLVTAPIQEKPVSVPEPISVTVEPKKETILPAMPAVQEKPLEHKEKPKSRRNQKAKEQIELLNAQKEQPVRSVGQVVKDNNQMFNIQPEQPMPVQQDLQAQFYGQISDPKQIISKQIPEVQKPEPYRKTRKQKANAKANHQVEVPGTFYPPVYNAVDHSLHLTHSLQGGDASEKENEEKLPQPYNFDAEKHEDADNLRVSGDEGGSNADKRTRRGRKQQNYKEMNSGVHGRTTSPRSRSSPRSPRTGMSPRQALSPLSSPKAEFTAPFVKIERLPFSCNKNVRPEGELLNEAIDGKQQMIEAVENQSEHLGLTGTKKMIEEIVKPASKEATNVFDFDDNEPELKIVTTPLKATRPKKGRRNTQDTILPPQPPTPEVKISPNGPNHIVSPLEGRWQCKKDSESDKNGNHPLKLRIALTHTTGMSTNTTNSISSMINTATIIDSTIPSIKEKKDLESLTKVSCATTSSIMSTIASVASNSAPTMANLCMDKMSNVDRIIDDVSKGIFDWNKGNGQIEPTKEQIMMSMANMMPKVTDSMPIALQPTKKRHTQNRHIGELDMMPPPMTSLPGHDLGLAKSSPSLVQPPMASSPFGSNVMSMSQGHPPVQTPPLTSASIPVSVACTSSSHSSQVQMGEQAVTSFSQARPTSQITTTKNKPLDMALNMTSRVDVMTSAAHSLSTAAVVTQTTTTTIAQHSPGPSVVMSSQKPMVTSSGNTTVLAGRTVTVKPPNTEAYLQQMGLHPSAIPSQAPVSAHQVSMPRMPDNKQAFPHGFLSNPPFSRPENLQEHSRPIPASSSEKQPQVTSSAPTCVVHPITTSSGKTMDPKLLQHQQMMQASAVSRAPVVSTTSSGHSIPPAHMHLSQALMEKEQHMRNMVALHNQPMMHLMGQPHVMANHIQHKPEKTPKGKQSHKAELPQPNEPLQRPPSAHSQKPQSNEPQRPHSAHENQMLQEQIRNLMGKGMIHPGAIPPQILQMYHQQQQMAAAKMEEKKGHKSHPPKEMVSPGIAHQPSSMFATSIASQSSNPQIKSPALAQTAPSPHPVFSQPSTSQARPISPGMKKQLNEKFNQNQWTSEISEAQRSGPSSGEPSPSPKHWGYSGSQQPKPAHQQNLDSSSKTHQEAIRLIEQHKQQEMIRMQQQQDHAKLQEIQRQEIERREELIRQAALKSREGVPSTSASTSQQSDRDRQTASVPGKPRSSHLPNHSESGPSVMDPRNLHHLQELRAGPRGHGAFAAPSGELIQGIPAHLYRDPEFQQRIHAAAALRMPHLLDPHMYPQGYPLGLPHPYLGQVGGLPIDHPHLADQRPPSQGGSSHGMRSPPPRQAHQAVAKSPAIPTQQNRQMPDPPPGGEGSLLSLLQRYPVMWQGTLALKNDSCAVQMHVISGFNSLVQTALPQQVVEGTCQPLRIAQRMRLEAAQLEGVIKRMQYDKDYCMLLALPCGSDHDDIIYQTRAMSTGFIQYLQQKQAAGIVNVADPGSQQPAYVVHIFPPCEFSHETLGRLGFELLHQVRNLSHLLVIITTVA
ncbi:msx2-interacting protein-like isoform X2 [Mytilus californianus]|uniref:msx2-interacting protein-like isoform X2 n=1 Tax=Mytilus californianus TaxID=6549 RepID=UPI0022467920|nr:msx2-interacting protein-like isoform X2 [Mytilus californianus]